MSAGGGKKAILAALSANLGIAIAKFVGAAITGSASMLAEGVHSVADTGNQGLLLLGQNRAEQEADEKHQFGYGRNRYFYSFVVALVLFSLGAMFSLYEGIHKIQHPEELTSPIVAIVILVLAVGLEGFSFITAMRESAPLRGNLSWWRFIRNSRNPELPVVLLEDTGALIGLIFALAAVLLTMFTGDPIWDGIGTLCIGALLGAIAIVLIVEMKSLLIGEGATPDQTRKIRENLVDGARIDRVIHLRTEYLGPEELLIAAKVSIVPGLEITDIAQAIDDAESRVRTAVPTAKLMYIEPDLYRSGATTESNR
ncbi:cation diffusion facilitator family transporter [Nocardia pseudobrasiliensis]|uniref:Cation diffusion facilitator family transporter n=1 Tax=Nocardia pseudobrasiliensis TaxID=45979 RepID=A0A370IDB4_9NOCA|nr:cation diffusion facilitator family transporter [Nocardia pseudobrasiliensis]RDI68699.1 cation diffusion facilitator family transporter [Nocardia pseudobrasiliensis]